MRHWLGWWLVLLAGLTLGVGSSAQASSCPGVFPKDATSQGVVLDLGFIGSSPNLQNFPTPQGKLITVTPAGDYYYRGGEIPTNTDLVVSTVPGEVTRIYIFGDLIINPHSKLNPNGIAKNLIIVVTGNVVFKVDTSGGNKNEDTANALIYAGGNITLGNSVIIDGALTAVGSVTLDGGSVKYDADAAASADFGSYLCRIDHYRLSYASPALTCKPHPVTIQACVDAACTSTFSSGASTVTLSPSSGWVGSNTLSFTGSTSRDLSIRSAGTVTLAASGTLATTRATQCQVYGVGTSSTCRLDFIHPALQVSVLPQPLIAGQQGTATISATDPSCAPTLAETGPRELEFWSSYVDPGETEQVGGQPVRLWNQGVEHNVGKSLAQALPLTVVFSEGAATLPIQYDDAGKMRLHVRYKADTRQPPYGDFVSRPYALKISADGLDASGCFDSGGTLNLDAPSCPQQRAGDAFSLRIRPVALDGITPTRNFRLDNVALSSSVAAPAGGNNGSLLAASYNHPLELDGNGDAVISRSQQEVGIFHITATPPANGYFGYTVPSGTSGPVGRFMPAYLDAKVENAVLLPGCAGSSFTYQEQPMRFSDGSRLIVTGMNRQGGRTRNYDDRDFWRFDSALQHRFFSATGQAELDRRLRLADAGVACSASDAWADCTAARLAGTSAFELLADERPGDGSRAYRLTGEPRYTRHPLGPQDSDLPFQAGLRLFVPGSQLQDRDGAFYSLDLGASRADYLTPADAVIGGTQVHLGRLRIEDDSGSEKQTLELPYWLESWQASPSGPTFSATTGDSCTTQAALGQVALADFTGDLQAGHFPTPPGTLEAAPASTPRPTGVIRLPAPNHTGSVLASLSGLNGTSPALPWLLFDWDGDGSVEAPAARATFGVYSGPRALIFRRELYRP